MHLIPLKVPQQVVYHLCLRHKVGGSDECLPPKALGLAKVGQKVLDVEYALYVVLCSLIDGDSAVVVGNDAGEYVAEGGLDVEIDNVNAAGPNLLCHFASEANDALEHAALLGDVLLVCQLHCLLKVIHGQHLRFVVCEPFGDDFASDEQSA